MRDSPSPSRRRFLKAAGTAGAAALAPIPVEAKNREAKAPYLFFNPAEAAFVEAATARLIPKDETGPGAIEAGVPQYIDKQLAGAWGAGDRLYRSGPWRVGTPTQGYQLQFTPAEFFRNAIRALNDRHAGFASMEAKAQDDFLQSLSKSAEDLNGVPASEFLSSLLEVTIEGFFADPAYGGNKDMVAWKMVGFPGAYADFYQHVDNYGVAYTAPPTSLAEDASGRIHVMKRG